jgi:hypothetical protein
VLPGAALGELAQHFAAALSSLQALRFTCCDSHAAIRMLQYTCCDSHAAVHMLRSV